MEKEQSSFIVMESTAKGMADFKPEVHRDCTCSEIISLFRIFNVTNPKKIYRWGCPVHDPNCKQGA